MPMPIDACQARPTPILSALAGHTIQHEDGQKPRLQPFHPGRWPVKNCAPFSDCSCRGAEWIPIGCQKAYRRSNESNVWRGHSTHTGKTPQTFLHQLQCKKKGIPSWIFSDHCNRFWQVEHAKFNMPKLDSGFRNHERWSCGQGLAKPSH